MLVERRSEASCLRASEPSEEEEADMGKVHAASLTVRGMSGASLRVLVARGQTRAERKRERTCVLGYVAVGAKREKKGKRESNSHGLKGIE